MNTNCHKHIIYKTAHQGLLKLVIATIMMTFIMGCSESRNLGSTEVTYKGSPQKVGAGSAYAFTTFDASGKPSVIGVKMTEAALMDLPAEPPHGMDAWEYIIPLPKEAAISGYDHIGIDWNPRGHIPNGVYNMPHFDFHFYLINQEERDEITAKGEDITIAHKQPALEFMPEGYILPEGTEVPRMGAHAIDPASPEFNKIPFTKTFIYGFYGGQMVFLEPMMTKAFLETNQNTTDHIKLPKAYAKHAYYPAAYSVKYDVAQRKYEVSLGGLVYK